MSIDRTPIASNSWVPGLSRTARPLPRSIALPFRQRHSGLILSSESSPELAVWHAHRWRQREAFETGAHEYWDLWIPRESAHIDAPGKVA